MRLFLIFASLVVISVKAQSPPCTSTNPCIVIYTGQLPTGASASGTQYIGLAHLGSNIVFVPAAAPVTVGSLSCSAFTFNIPQVFVNQTGNSITTNLVAQGMYHVARNGIIQSLTVDYTVNGQIITFVTPLNNDIIQVW
jgi:hypothetical protein